MVRQARTEGVSGCVSVVRLRLSWWRWRRTWAEAGCFFDQGFDARASPVVFTGSAAGARDDAIVPVRACCREARSALRLVARSRLERSKLLV